PDRLFEKISGRGKRGAVRDGETRPDCVVAGIFSFVNVYFTPAGPGLPQLKEAPHLQNSVAENAKQTVVCEGPGELGRQIQRFSGERLGGNIHLFAVKLDCGFTVFSPG